MRGFSLVSKKLFITRFELHNFIIKKEKSLVTLSLDQRKIMNMYLSQIISINYGIKDLVKYNILRLYLIKSFRGRSQAMGKPSRGQRTWSNAWTSYKYNRMLRQFIMDIRKNNLIKKKPEYKNKKFLKKKLKKPVTRNKIKQPKKKINLWF
jgi:ribosomal protein S13